MLATSHPVVAGRDGLFVPHSQREIHDGMVLLMCSNFSGSTITVQKGTAVARCSAIEEEGYHVFTLDEVSPGADSSQLLKFDQHGLQHTAGQNMAAPVAPLTGADSIEGLDLSQTALSDHELSLLCQFLAHNCDVFSTGDTPGLVQGVEHMIDTDDHTPIYTWPYHAGQRDCEAQSAHVKEMLAKNVIHASMSAWSSPVVMVPKKDGKVQFCIDYWKVNAVTKKEKYPLPCIDDLLSATQGAMYFTALDDMGLLEHPYS